MHALVLAGGRGTRLRPLTLARPKPMVPFVGSPYAAGLLRQLAGAGVDRVSLLVGAHHAEDFGPLHDVADELGCRLDVVTEEERLDTAGAARRLLRGSGERDVLVCNGDMLSDVDHAALLAAHRSDDAVATLAVKHVDDVSSYGVLELADDGGVDAFLEKPDPSTTDVDTVNAGAYVLDASAFDHLDGDGPLSFEYDVFPSLLERGERLQGVDLPAHWQDLGTPERFLAGTAAVLDGDCDWPLRDGLRLVGGGLVGPSLVDVDAGLGDEVSLHHAVIDADCRVGDRVHLRNSVLLPGATVESGAHLDGVIVGAGARVTADTQLRDDVLPDAELAAA